MNEQPWDALVSCDVVSQLHAEAISRYGGDKSPQSLEGCVEKSLGAAWNAELYAGAEDAVGGLCFAGCLMFYLIKNHCFVDGNKRVGWSACMEALRNMGLTIIVDDDAAEQFCLDIISGAVANAVDVSL
ncbi:MAG TPA: Fic family protein, partial [Thermoanaerobaculia bacterium]